MKQIKWYVLPFAGLLFVVVMLNACRSVKNLTGMPEPWAGGPLAFTESVPYDSSKKNVFIIADYKLTELFDMIAPYHLFSATGKANVYIVSPNEKPILIKRDLFVKPQLTFSEVDARHLKADVIVIPALSIRNNRQDSAVVAWIKNHVTSTTRLLSICDGASTGATTGLYDGKPLTCHASDYAGIKQYFKNPDWIQNVSVAKSGNFYSTAGVSNAVEGSLAVIEDLFGSEERRKSMKGVNYPHSEIRIEHESIAVSGRDKFTALKKICFRRNKNLCFVLEEGVNEFQLASILDTYARTFPATMTTYIPNDTTVRTKFGLRLIYTGRRAMPAIDEVHVLPTGSVTREYTPLFGKAKIIRYDMLKTEYPFDACLGRISTEFGRKFEQLVKISLDYN